VDTPFVLGIIKPKIYLPVGLNETEREYILLHEQNHIHRGDHIIRIVSYLALCIHWFNPLVWIAFRASGKDMEMANDESVIRRKGESIKKDYSSSLLALSTGRRGVSPVPLAFGEEDPKRRIKNIINYKRPVTWIVVAALLIVIGITAGLLMNRSHEGPMEQPIGKITYVNAASQEVTQDIQWNYYNWQVQDPETGKLTYEELGGEALYPAGGTDTISLKGTGSVTFSVTGEVKPDAIYVTQSNNSDFIAGILNNANPKSDEVAYESDYIRGTTSLTFEVTSGNRYGIGAFYGDSWVFYLFYVPSEEAFDTTVQFGHIYFNDSANPSAFSFEAVEWVGFNQVERIAELGLNPDDDLPNGFYLYVPPVDQIKMQITDATRYFIIDAAKKPVSEVGYEEVGKQEFLVYQYQTPSFASVTPYWVEVKDGYVTVIAQQYLP
jgi:hypothetical protein